MLEAGERQAKLRVNLDIRFVRFDLRNLVWFFGFWFEKIQTET